MIVLGYVLMGLFIVLSIVSYIAIFMFIRQKEKNDKEFYKKFEEILKDSD